MQELVTVLTPVFNRKHKIGNLFRSLQAQTVQNFRWLIIDDGSTDGLAELIPEIEEQANYTVQYCYKENGGKHTALNLGFQMVETELTFIVDSDDMLTPDAIESIEKVWSAVASNRLAGVSFLRGYSEEQVIGDRFPSEGIYNGIDIQFRHKIGGDKSEVWRTDILKKYRFPVFEGEKFQGENYIWWQIALEYDLYYVNQIIYITEYLVGGLTRSGKPLRIRNPLGGMENSRMGLDKRFPLRERCKRAWLYVCYGKFAGKRFGEIVKGSGYPILIGCNYPFGLLLYKYWKHKYL